MLTEDELLEAIGDVREEYSSHGTTLMRGQHDRWYISYDHSAEAVQWLLAGNQVQVEAHGITCNEAAAWLRQNNFGKKCVNRIFRFYGGNAYTRKESE